MSGQIRLGAADVFVSCLGLDSSALREGHKIERERKARLLSSRPGSLQRTCVLSAFL